MSLEADLHVPEGNVLVSTYAGLGDAIICGPLLRSLSRYYPGRILYVENPVIDLYKALEVEGLCEIGVVGRKLRRFVDFTSEDLVAELRHHNINVVFNLRRDRVKFKGRYEEVARAVNKAGVRLTDVCESVGISEQTEIHTFDLCANYFRTLGLLIEQHRFGWLREGARFGDLWEKPSAGIGFFIGAGHPVKRMTAGFWRALINQLHGHCEEPAFVMCGISEEERDAGAHLSSLLDEDDVRHELISGLSLLALANMVCGMRLVVSCDTFMVHLAEALGVRVVSVHCSTDSVVYGPYHRLNTTVQSSYYAICPLHNQIGNCDGWDVGCADTPCKNFVSVSEVADRAFEALTTPCVSDVKREEII